MKALTLSKVRALPVGAIVRWEHAGRTYRGIKVGEDTWCDEGKSEAEMDDASIVTGPPAFLVATPDTLTGAIAAVLAEREKQRAKWGDAHDDEHAAGELADAAAFLSLHATETPPGGSWAHDLHRRHDRRGRLVIAAALLLAEIERMDRARATAGEGQ